MTSKPLRDWAKARAAQLDEIRAAHTAVGGSSSGRRYATQQINQAYLVMLSGQFQGFCRDLHGEAADYVVNAAPAAIQNVIRRQFMSGRCLDRGRSP